MPKLIFIASAFGRGYFTMRIEDEIQVDKFPSEEQKLSINLIFTNGWAYDKLQNFFGEHGLTSQQYNILRILRGSNPNALSTAEILERMMEKSAGVSRLVDRLLRKKLVSKRTRKTDKRQVDVKITEAGMQVLQQMDNERNRIDAIYQNLNPKEIETLNNLLDKLRG